MNERRNEKRIILTNAFNVRDLGGYTGEDGNITKWNQLIRSDGISKLNEQDWDILVKKGVRTVIDLRSISETKMQPDVVPSAVTYVHCPLQKEDLDINNPTKSVANAFSKSLTQGYQSIVCDGIDLLVNALKQVIRGLESGAVLFHCSAGKDRTGVLAAVLLYLLGVEDEDIIADYQVSYTYNRRGINEAAKSLPNYEDFKMFLYSNPEYMETLLAYFGETDLSKTLYEAGLQKKEVKRLKNIILDI